MVSLSSPAVAYGPRPARRSQTSIRNLKAMVKVYVMMVRAEAYRLKRTLAVDSKLRLRTGSFRLPTWRRPIFNSDSLEMPVAEGTTRSWKPAAGWFGGGKWVCGDGGDALRVGGWESCSTCVRALRLALDAGRCRMGLPSPPTPTRFSSPLAAVFMALCILERVCEVSANCRFVVWLCAFAVNM
jgi:hypothetical protein